MFFLGTCFSLMAQAQTNTVKGFSAAAAKNQLFLEQSFDKNIEASNIGNTIKELAAKPHHLGSPGSKAVAEDIYNRFKSYGFDVRIETYSVLFPVPVVRQLEMTAPSIYKALLKELPLKEDATSSQADQLPTCNIWSADGDVTGELVFVNYGLPQDYEMLERMGIDVKGKIVIAKYGNSWRGIKPKVAQEHGAVGCIIYSDPANDGYAQGDVYPAGPYKNETMVQRGSVLDMVIYPGDPLTEGIGATENAKRIASHNDAPNLLKIPVLPVSYKDALPLLTALGGHVVPNAWRGALPITYHTGPGKTKVHLKTQFDWKLVPCYNVIAKITGSTYPDEWVIRGNHHDAWVNGAQDPISGQAAMLEEAKSLGELLKTGWKPKRTIIYCAWDGEEPGLIGSTEWAEDHANELQQKAVAYINSDGNGRGFLYAGGSHALEQMVTEAAGSVTDPQTNVSVLKRAQAAEAVSARDIRSKKEAMTKEGFNFEALGSGSDYSSFLQHLGVPSLNLGFGGEDDGGEYHSIFDSYDMYRRFKDPSFQYGVVLSKTAGHIMLRLANAETLPFNFSNVYTTIAGYAKELENKLDDMRETTAIENKLIGENFYGIAADTAMHIMPPTIKNEVPYLDFSAMQNALAMLKKSTDSLQSKYAGAENSGQANMALNKLLYTAEQQLLLPAGLPRRGWYKHSIYAPGFYTGYGVKTLPGIREAIEQRNWGEAQQQIVLAAGAVKRLAEKLMQ